MTTLPIRDDLRGERPYGAPQLAVPVILNVNENPYPPSEALVADAATAVADVVRGLNRYPDREATQLRADLARYLEKESDVTVETRQVWAANGSNEIMQQVLQAFGGPGRTAMSFSPTYSMYPEYARNTNTEYVDVPRAEDFSIDRAAALGAIATHRPSVILLASPNNPTGTALDLDVISELHASTDGIVVVDEAYAEFRRGGTASAATLVHTHPRLVVTRTMSKAFAFAGARVGYAIAQIPVIDALRIVRLPYHLSAVTQVVARVALAHVDELQADVATLRTDRDALAEWLLWNGFEAPPSDANFILFGPFADRHAVWQGLVDRGVLVREVGPDGWLRVSIGRRDEISAFKSALLEVVQVNGGADDDSVFGAPSDDAGEEPGIVETVGSKLQALRVADDAAEAPEQTSDAPVGPTEPVVDDDRPDEPAVHKHDVADHAPEAVVDAPADSGAAFGPESDNDESDNDESDNDESDDDEPDDAANDDHDPAGDIDTQGDDGDAAAAARAAEQDEQVALAVLRDQAESAADQMTDQLVDEERRG